MNVLVSNGFFIVKNGFLVNALKHNRFLQVALNEALFIWSTL